ncbi:MAG TPA: sigma-70 family RNA polymerase sigma factor [Solirubrobacteraceae bacterium]
MEDTNTDVEGMAGTLAPAAPLQVRPGPTSTDADLVAATRSGDDRAFEELYARYHRRIAAYIFGMVKDHARAEDVTQDVFMSALRRMRNTDRDIAFKPWVYEIAKNACIDQFRRSRRGEEVSYDAEEGLSASDYGKLTSADLSPDAALAAKQDLDHLCGAFGGLSESHHQILVMRELEGLSYREIGERMGMSRPSVESTLFRARKRLSEEYEELVSGERCTRVLAIIADAIGGGLGTRDQRRMARHVSYCQGCRRHAKLAGLGDMVPVRTGVRAKIAAFMPLPIFLRDRWMGVGAGTHDSGAGLTSWLAGNAPLLEPAAGWSKAVVAAVAVAVAGVGAGVAVGGPASVARLLGAGSLVGGSGHDSSSSSSSSSSVPAAGHHAAKASAHPTVAKKASAGTLSASTTKTSAVGGAGDTAPASGSGGSATGAGTSLPVDGSSAPAAPVSVPQAPSLNAPATLLDVTTPIQGAVQGANDTVTSAAGQATGAAGAGSKLLGTG